MCSNILFTSLKDFTWNMLKWLQNPYFQDCKQNSSLTDALDNRTQTDGGKIELKVQASFMVVKLR